MHLPARRSIVPLAAASVLALAPALAGASSAPAAPAPAAAAPTGPNPWVSEPVSATGLDYAGWTARIRALGRVRVASPQYAAARTAAGLDAAPLTTTYTDLGTVIDQLGTGADQRRRLRVTGLPDTGGFALPTLPGYFAVAALTGPGQMTVQGGDGAQTGDADAGTNVSGLYPLDSPVLGTGTTSMVVYDQLRGRSFVGFTGATSATRLDVEVYAFGTQSPAHRAQTVVLDVDGATLDTTPYGGSGVSTLSPLSSFLGAWGLRPGQEKALVNATLATVRQTLTANGARVTVVSTLSGTDPFGAQDVSRVVLGGTRAQTGLAAISASAHLDPGNIDHEETSLVLLDALSAPATTGLGDDDPSLNAWMGTSSDRVAFVSKALANLVLHEIGHSIGLFDTDDLDGNRSVMDSGGHQLENNLFPVGPDGTGGTADDVPEFHLTALGNLHPLQGMGTVVAPYNGVWQFFDRVRDQAYWVKPV